MCFLAMTLSNYFVAPLLAAGPPASTVPEQVGCGPFNRVSVDCRFKTKQTRSRYDLVDSSYSEYLANDH